MPIKSSFEICTHRKTIFSFEFIGLESESKLSSPKDSPQQFSSAKSFFILFISSNDFVIG